MAFLIKLILTILYSVSIIQVKAKKPLTIHMDANQVLKTVKSLIESQYMKDITDELAAQAAAKFKEELDKQQADEEYQPEMKPPKIKVSKKKSPERTLLNKKSPENKWSEYTTPVKSLPQKKLPKKALSEKTFSEEHFPENKLLEEKLPEEHLPEGLLPKQHLPEMEFEEEQFPEKQFPEKQFQEEQLPEEHWPEENLPEDQFQEEQFPEDQFQDEQFPKNILPGRTMQKQRKPEKALTLPNRQYDTQSSKAMGTAVHSSKTKKKTPRYDRNTDEPISESEGTLLDEKVALSLLKDPSPDGDDFQQDSLELEMSRTPPPVKSPPQKINGRFMRRLLTRLQRRRMPNFSY